MFAICKIYVIFGIMFTENFYPFTVCNTENTLLADDEDDDFFLFQNEIEQTYGNNNMYQVE